MCVCVCVCVSPIDHTVHFIFYTSQYKALAIQINWGKGLEALQGPSPVMDI